MPILNQHLGKIKIIKFCPFGKTPSFVTCYLLLVILEINYLLVMGPSTCNNVHDYGEYYNYPWLPLIPIKIIQRGVDLAVFVVSKNASGKK